MKTNIETNLRSQFEALCNRLSPENLCCDGEIPRSQVNIRYRQIRKAWKRLEREAGRTVSQEEIELEQYKNNY